MVRFLAGDISEIQGHVKRENPQAGTETSAFALIRTVNGQSVLLQSSSNCQYFNFELDLHFEAGRLSIGNTLKEYYVTENSRHYTGFRDLVKKEFPSCNRITDPFSGALRELMQALDNNSDPQSSGIDGFKAMEAIYGVYYSALCGGKNIRMPLKIKGHPLGKMFKKKLL
jgi:hypothetical protein